MLESIVAHDPALRMSLVVALLATLGCAKEADEPKRLRAPPEAVPQSVSIPTTQMTVGTKLGSIRKSVEVKAFEISRFPTTVHQYSLCVKSSACSPPRWDTPACTGGSRGIDAQTYDDDETYADAPVTCVSPDQAKAYCSWVGGQRASVEEWLLAARGSEPTRFSWGEEEPTCARYWRTWTDSDDAAEIAAARCDGPEVPVVGQRMSGKSPFNVEDVLMTQGELVGGYPGSALPACRGSRGCVVKGFTLGAIDLVVPVTPATAEQKVSHIPTAGFRCVWRSST